MVKDQVSWTSEPSAKEIVTNMTFADVFHAININTLTADGLVGFSPSSTTGDHLTLLQQMYNQGIIKKNMFSLHLGLNDNESRIWFGGYDRSVIKEHALRDDPKGKYDKMTNEELDD